MSFLGCSYCGKGHSANHCWDIHPCIHCNKGNHSSTVCWKKSMANDKLKSSKESADVHMTTQSTFDQPMKIKHSWIPPQQRSKFYKRLKGMYILQTFHENKMIEYCFPNSSWEKGKRSRGFYFSMHV